VPKLISFCQNRLGLQIKITILCGNCQNRKYKSKEIYFLSSA
jgi:hypothetical protein